MKDVVTGEENANGGRRGGLPLKTRLALALAIAFLGILAVGSVIGTLQARASIETELDAARVTAVNRVAQLIASLPASNNVPDELQSFVRTFNGDRHVQMMLIDASGAVRVQSEPARQGAAMPIWFVRLLAPPPSAVITPLSGMALPMTAAVVSINPRNEVYETFSGFITGGSILALFVLVAFAAVWQIADRALRPVHALREAFAEVGKDRRPRRLEPSGPPEMRTLVEGYNAMTERLAAMSQHNQRLSEQLLRLQDEERTALARDLHDDVGPLLFAIDVDASAIARSDTAEATRKRASAIKDAAAKARRQVRRILSDLRPGTMQALGLKASVEEMVAGVRRRHPDIALDVEVTAGEFGDNLETLILRAVREAVFNALRHGRPRHIRVRIDAGDGQIGFCVVDDGGGFPETGKKGGLGLVGMRERVEAAGGTFTISEIPFPPGVRIEGHLPMRSNPGHDGDPGTERVEAA